MSLIIKYYINFRKKISVIIWLKKRAFPISINDKSSLFWQVVYIGYIVDIQNLIRNEILKIILFFHFIILSNIIILHLLLKKKLYFENKTFWYCYEKL